MLQVTGDMNNRRCGVDNRLKQRVEQVHFRLVIDSIRQLSPVILTDFYFVTR